MTSNGQTTITHVPVILNDNLIGKVASFFDTGGRDLMSICLALGPISAAEIRRSYLCGNDKYLVKLLRLLMTTESPHCVKPSTIASPKAHVFCGDRMAMSIYDKVRDQITQWMEANSHGEDDWRNRINAKNLKRHRRFRLEADNIFNNLALASSIGLIDVVRYLVEEVRVDVQNSAKGKQWQGIIYDTQKIIMSPIELAVARFDIRIVQCLLSSDTLDFEGLGYHRAMRMVLLSPAISKDQLRDFVTLPRVHVNAIFTNTANYTASRPDEPYDDRSMLMIALRRAFDLAKLDRHPADQRLWNLIHKIDVLLEAGADPTLVLPDGGMHFGSANNSALNYATNAMEGAERLDDHNEKDNILQGWGVVVERLKRTQV